MAEKTQTTPAYYDRIMEKKLIEWINEERFNWIIEFVKNHPDLDFQTGKNRDSSWFSVYRGTGRVLTLKWGNGKRASKKIYAAEKYKDLAKKSSLGIYDLTTWEEKGEKDLTVMFDKLLEKIKGDSSLFRYYKDEEDENGEKEGYYQTLVSRRYTLGCEESDDLLIFDKEFIIRYTKKDDQKDWQDEANGWTAKKIKEIEDELGKARVEKIENPGDEIDFVGINKNGDLILLEVKRKEDTSKIYLSPLQVGKYDELVRKLLNEQKEDFEKAVFEMIEQKKKLGILKPAWKEIHRELSGDVKLAVVVGGEASWEAKRRFCRVRDIVKKDISYYRCDPKGDGTLIKEDISVKKARREFLKEIYSKFFANSNGFDNVDIVCNNKEDSKTKTSFRFKEDDGEKAMDILARVFGISKTKMAPWLAGGTVDFRILTLHSSALLALLVFYNVDKNTKNTIVIERVKYDKVMFEVKNEVVGGGPSRVDVLLISEDEKTLLFLESKFTEPLNRGKVSGLSEAYESYYKNIEFDKIKGRDGSVLECIQDPKDKTFTIKKMNTRKTNHYCAGVKQMISHFIGLCKGPVEGPDKTYKDFFDNADNLILGEILFDFEDAGMKKKIDDYEELYKSLALVLNDVVLKDDKKKEFKKIDEKGLKYIDKISVREHVLTYQDILKNNPNYKLDGKVEQFYHFDNDRKTAIGSGGGL